MTKISILSQEVVDRIAAGEVVQRASAAVKELLENSLDAGCTDVSVTTDGIDRIVIADDGCGIEKVDLSLAAVRHATSKLQSFEDLNTIQSFGFRGEALASISMVSRLSIVSRTKSEPVGYKLSYLDGKPTTSNPIPTARKIGTTITVNDLFYNMLHRKNKTKTTEEYHATLKVVQQYAIHYASSGIAFHCHRITSSGSGGSSRNSSGTSDNKTDLNTSNAVKNVSRKRLDINHSPVTLDRSDAWTDEHDTNRMNESQIQATKDVIGQVYGSQLLPHLHTFSCALSHAERKTEADDNHLDGVQELTATTTPTNKMDVTSKENRLIFACTGMVSSPSYQSTSAGSKSSGSIQFLLFVNNRLVDGCQSLKRTIESVYGQFTKAKPFVYLSLTVPSHEVDVNVHPTKREVALLYLDEISNHITQHLKEHLSSLGETFLHSPTATFNSAVMNPYMMNTKKRKQTSLQLSAEENLTTSKSQNSTFHPKQEGSNLEMKKLIRSSRTTQSGSLEPYLVSTQRSPDSQARQPFASQIQQNTMLSQASQPALLSQAFQAIGDADDTIGILSSPLSSQTPKGSHQQDCPLSVTKSDDADLTEPGAFARISALCTCNNSRFTGNDESSLSMSPAATIRLPQQPIMRPRLPTPHPCSFHSIQSLRKQIETQTDYELQKKFRSSCFVGVISHARSLIQCGEELVMINHHECFKEMFYQLALNRFGSGDRASFETSAGIDIATVVGQMVQLEEMICHASSTATSNSDKSRECFSLEAHVQLTNCAPILVDETNQAAANEAAESLYENADMLRDYFSIIIEKKSDSTTDHQIVLTGLPILLDGYEPACYGIPLFLLRLATEVNWDDEKQCFHDVSMELASFYAQLPSASVNEDDRQFNSLVRHTVFPAITALLSPSKDITRNKYITVLASLTGLYKVFERC